MKKTILLFPIMLLFFSCDFSGFFSEAENGTETLSITHISINVAQNTGLISENIEGLISGNNLYFSIPSACFGTNTKLIPSISTNYSCSFSPDPAGGLLFDHNFTLALSRSGYNSATYKVFCYVD